MAHEQTLIRLLLAAIMGGVVGLERESLNRPAGLRTHVLVCVGAALVMIVSQAITSTPGGQSADPSRIAAQVVSGIGFLGAGTILRDGSTIRGLTTAASLWVIAGIGLAVGSGLFVPGAMAAVIVLCALALLSRLERAFLHRRRSQTLLLTIADRPGQIGRVGTTLGDHRVNITTMQVRSGTDAGQLLLDMTVVLPQGLTCAHVADTLMSLDGVSAVEYAGMR